MIEKYWESVLQTLAYWVAYKKACSPSYQLPEAALVAELMQLLFSKISLDQRIECEKAYADMVTTGDFGDQRADIVIGKKTRNRPNTGKKNILTSTDVTEVVEVKRAMGGAKTAIFKDSVKLNGLKRRNPKLRCYQIVVCQKKLPKWACGKVSKDNASCYYPGRKNVYSGTANVDVRIRRCRKSFATKKDSKSGVYVFLLEVM